MKKLGYFAVGALALVSAGCSPGGTYTGGGGGGGTPISVTITNKISTVSTGGSTVTLNATVQYDAANKGVTWTLSCSPTCGTLTGATATSVIYTPPTTQPSAPNNTPTIVATSVADPTKSDKDTFLIAGGSTACNGGSETKLKGQYAFAMQGYDSGSKPVYVTGSFTADGAGHISAGVEDLNNTAGSQQNLAITTATSSYAVGTDNRGCLTLVTPAGTSTYRFALGSINSLGVATKGRFIEFDVNGTGSGVIRLQDPSAFSLPQISGSYAFGISGRQLDGHRVAAVGQFVTDGAGKILSGNADNNHVGEINNTTSGAYPMTPLSFTGTYTVSSNGRGTMILNSGGSTGFMPDKTEVNASFYVVSASELLITRVDTGLNSLFSGTVLRQTTPFAQNSLNGTSVFSMSGISGSTDTAANVQLGMGTSIGAGQLSFTGDQNLAGVVGSLSFTTNYQVQATGRVTTSGGGWSIAPVLYLVNTNQGFVMGTDSAVTFGAFEPQTGGPFTTASVKGTFVFGTTPPVNATMQNQTGLEIFDGLGGVTGTSNQSSTGGLTFPNTYAVVAGRGTTPASGTPTSIFYMVSPTKAVQMDATPGSANPASYVLEQ